MLDDILSIESSSLADSMKLDASYSSDLSIKQEPSTMSDAEIHALAKDRQKKDNHNMSKLLKVFLYLLLLLYEIILTFCCDNKINK